MVPSRHFPVVLWLACAPMAVHAQDVVEACVYEVQSIAEATGVHEDPTGKLTAHDVASLPDSAFMPLREEMKKAGPSSAMWLRWRVVNGSDGACRTQLGFRVEDLVSRDYYALLNGRNWDSYGGIGNNDWMGAKTNSAYPFFMEYGDSALVLARVVSGGDKLLITKPKPRLMSEDFASQNFDNVLKQNRKAYEQVLMWLGMALALLLVALVVLALSLHARHALARQLREALDARNALLARISHDLRAPLARVIGYAKMSQVGNGADLGERIERSAWQMLEMIEELLEFSRVETRAVAIVPQPGYLHSFLQWIEDEGRALAERRGNAFNAAFHPDLPVAVVVDFRRLRQILLNLLGNAAKYTHRGDITFAVRAVERDARAAKLRFDVSDTGIGIPEAEHGSVMLPFVRGGNVDGIEGAGLGLSIVNQLLEGMGSRLELESTAGGGSRFGFVLDVSVVEEAAVGTAFIQSHGAQVEGRGRRVLVVEDVAFNREWLNDLLCGHGFAVEVAQDGAEALAKLDSGRFDLLLCDQKMPGMDGWALLGRVREAWPDLPAVLYSAAPPQPPPGNAHRFDAVLLKPAGSDELLASIDRLAGMPRG